MIGQSLAVTFAASLRPYVLVATFFIISFAFPLAVAALHWLDVGDFLVRLPLPVPFRFSFIKLSSAGGLRIVRPNRTVSITFSVPPFNSSGKDVTLLTFSN
jgi:hypothetical protein